MFSRRICYISINTIYVIIAKHYTFLFLYYIKEKNHCIKKLGFQMYPYSVIEYSFYYMNILIKIINDHKITNKNKIIVLHYCLNSYIITTPSITFFCLLKHAYIHCVLYFKFINITTTLKKILKFDKYYEITLDMNTQCILFLLSFYQKVLVKISSRYNHFYIVKYLTLNYSIYTDNTSHVKQNKKIIYSHWLKPTKDINYCLGFINGVILYCSLVMFTGQIIRIRVKYIIYVWDLINLTKILNFIVLFKNEIFDSKFIKKKFEITHHKLHTFFTRSTKLKSIFIFIVYMPTILKYILYTYSTYTIMSIVLQLDYLLINAIFQLHSFILNVMNEIFYSILYGFQLY